MSILFKLSFYCQVSHAYLCQDKEIIQSVFLMLDPFVKKITYTVVGSMVVFHSSDTEKI